MAKRGNAGRNAWPKELLFVVALFIAAALLVGCDSILQLAEVAEVAVLGDEYLTMTAQAALPTDTIQPTEATTPTPEPTETPTPEPTETPTPTITPYSTPEINSAEFRPFVVWTAHPILYAPPFYSKFPCLVQGRDWSENVDPFAKKYLSGIQYCLMYEYMDSTWEVVIDEDVLEQVELGNIETITLDEVVHLDGEIGVYAWMYKLPEGSLAEYVSQLEIPEWEWCLFVERLFRFYNYTWDDQEGTEEEIARTLKSIKGHYGNPSFCLNFDPSPGNPLYLVESKRLGLVEP